MDIIQKEDFEFCVETFHSGIEVVFSTSKNGLNFNKNLKEGKSNLNKLKELFDFDEIIYLSQVHGTKVLDYTSLRDIKNVEGDGLVTKEKNCAIGIFTADCVPIIAIDEVKEIICALHSGWKGTLNNIASEGIRMMKENYGSNPEDIKVIIGPHNRVCCYQVSEELINTFKGHSLFKNHKINEGRNLNLQKCVELELIEAGVLKKNIKSLNLCTSCSKEVELYSYRNPEESNGRLLSFVFMRG